MLTIHLPPLRDRGDDIIPLTDHFIQTLRRKYRRRQAAVTDEARQAIGRYHWPGNVRELCHVLERASLLAEDGLIQVEHLGLAVPTGSALAVPSTNVPNWTLAVMEQRMIEQAMQKTGGNVSRAARLLGITRGALRRRLAARPSQRRQSDHP